MTSGEDSRADSAWRTALDRSLEAAPTSRLAERLSAEIGGRSPAEMRRARERMRVRQWCSAAALLLAGLSVTLASTASPRTETEERTAQDWADPDSWSDRALASRDANRVLDAVVLGEEWR